MSERDSTMLECRELVVTYGDTVAVDQVSFGVTGREVFGLLGPNGAGKTSVIRALTTILKPRSGSATVAGAPLEDTFAVRRQIGVLPESNGYPGTQTGRGYLRFYGQLFGLTKAEADTRAGRLLGQLGLGQTDQRIATYSRGMRQRLGLCRAMINQPAVLFLDEPTLGLDPAGKEEIMGQLATVAAEHGTAVVLCTHLLDEVERVCDRVAILDHGRIVITGTVDEVIEAADIAGIARLRVAVDDIPAAQRILAECDAVDTVNYDNARPGDMDIELSSSVAQPANRVLGAVLGEGLEVRFFDKQRGSLNDAFLALTTGMDKPAARSET